MTSAGAAGLDAAVRHVHVRVGLVAVEEIGALDHGLREVAVEVERHRDRDRRADGAAHGRDQVAFAVVQALRHHRAVQVEQHAIEPARGSEVGEHPVLDVLVDVARDEPRRRGGRCHRGQEHRAAALGRLDHAAEARARPAIRLDDLPAVAQVVRLELRAVGGDIAERIGLVGHHGEKQVQRVLPSSRLRENRRMLKKVQMRGGARRPHARRSRSTLSVRPRAPTSADGPFSASC